MTHELHAESQAHTLCPDCHAEDRFGLEGTAVLSDALLNMGLTADEVDAEMVAGYMSERGYGICKLPS